MENILVSTNYSGSGFIGNKDISTSVSSALGNKIANFKAENGGKLTEADVHDLIRTAAGDDGKISQQEMDWINDGLASQGSIISKLSINKSGFGEAVQFTFSLADKSSGSEVSFKSEDIQKEAGKGLEKSHNTNGLSGGIGEIKAGDVSVLGKMTQKMAPSNFAENKCGPSCIVAAAIYSGGRDGLEKLADAANKQVKAPAQLPPEYADLTAKIKDKSKPLTKEDISKLQDMIYLVLTRMQSAKMQETGNNLNTGGGIHSTILKDFLKTPEMSGVISGSVNIRNVDISGDGNADHFTMFIKENSKNYSVYDPYPKTNGKQVSSAKADLKTYRDAVSDS